MRQLASPETPFDLMLSRSRDGGYVPGSDSERVLAIAGNGGGKAAATGLGEAQELVARGFHASFDMIYGESGAGGSTAGIVTDQLDVAEDIFVNVLSGKEFIDFKRAYKNGQQILNFHFLRSLMGEELDTAALKKSPIVFGLGFTDMEKFEPAVITNHDPDITESDLIDYMIWGMHMPLVAGAAPRDKYNRRVADIGLSSMQASIRAKDMGATDVVNLANHPIITNENGEPVYDIKHNRLMSALTGVWMEFNGRPGSGLDYYRFTKQQAEFLRSKPIDGVDIIAPDKRDELPTAFTSDPVLIKKGVEAGRRAASAALGFERKGVEVKPEAKDRLVHYIGLSAATRVVAV